MATPKHMLPVVEMIRAAPVLPPPAPWRIVDAFAVGGLLAVGFEEDGERLLLVSSSGQSLFDCRTGEHLHRNHDEDGFDERRLLALAVGHASLPPFRMAGLHGGGLPAVTADGWKADSVPVDWPIYSLLVTPPGSSYLGARFGKPHDFVKLAEEYEVRAYGFSWTGKTLIAATSSDVTIYGRT